MESLLYGGLAVTTLVGLAVAAFNRQNSSNEKVLATLAEHGEAFVRLETILTGATGNNGVVGDVKMLRERSHTLGEKLQGIVFRVAVLEDRRGDEPGRRVGDLA